MLESLQLSPRLATAVAALFATTLAAIAHRMVAIILRRATTPLPVVQTVVLVITALFILANLLVDLLYILVDPRMRRSGR